jgi:hypothetical protein
MRGDVGKQLAKPYQTLRQTQATIGKLVSGWLWSWHPVGLAATGKPLANAWPSQANRWQRQQMEARLAAQSRSDNSHKYSSSHC